MANEYKRYDFWGQIPIGPTPGPRGNRKLQSFDDLHTEIGSKSRKRVRVLWDTKYGRKKAKEIGAAAVAVLQACARKKARKRSKIWSGIADSIKYTLHRAKAGRMQIVVTVSHVSAMMKQYGGFIRAGGPFSETSKRLGRKAKFIAIPLRGGRTKGVRMGDLAMQFRKPGEKSYDRTKLQSAPLLRMISVDGERPKAKGGMWTVSKTDKAKWRDKAKYVVSRRGVVMRAAKKDPDLMDWYMKQEARYGIQETAAARKSAGKGVEDYMEGFTDGPDLERPWHHPKYGNLEMPKLPDKRLSDRSKWVKGLAPVGRMSSALKAYLDNADSSKMSKRQRRRFQQGFLETTRLVFTRSARDKIHPMYLLVKAQYIPPDPWIPSTDELNERIWEKIRSK